MSVECGWDREGWYEARDLQTTCRELRTDVDGLVIMVAEQRQQIADLQQQVRVLRARINSREMSAA